MPFTRRWTEEEKKNLSEHFAHIPTKTLAEAFPGRSPRALSDMAQASSI